jgi:hypothetical protein
MRDEEKLERRVMTVTTLPDLKVPRQASLILLVKVVGKEGKALGSEEGKASGSGHFYEQRKEVEQGLLLPPIGTVTLTSVGLH